MTSWNDDCPRPFVSKRSRPRARVNVNVLIAVGLFVFWALVVGGLWLMFRSGVFDG